MAIIKQFDKRSSITYVYDSKSFYDKETLQRRIRHLEQVNKFQRMANH